MKEWLKNSKMTWFLFQMSTIIISNNLKFLKKAKIKKQIIRINNRILKWINKMQIYLKIKTIKIYKITILMINKINIA